MCEAHQEKDAKAKDAEEVKPGAVPAYLLDREQVRRTKAPRQLDREGFMAPIGPRCKADRHISILIHF